MKRTFSIILMLALSLAAVGLAVAPAFADSKDDNHRPQPSAESLAIKAPNNIAVGQSVDIVVLDKRGNNTVSGASLYSMPADNLTIKPASDNYTALITAYAALIESQGTLIGTTSDNGTVNCLFAETGRFVLAAVKDGYMPGFSRLTVKGAPEAALSLTSPSSAALNETVTFTVLEKDNGQAIGGAAVYARRFGGNSPAGGKGFGLFGDKPNTTDSENWSAEIPGIKESGVLLGNTDSSGQVAYAFSTAGRYFLMAASDNFSPAYSMISVAISDSDNKQDDSADQLTITAPQTSPSGQQVTITVSDNATPVSGAAVYILNDRGAGVKNLTSNTSDSQKDRTDLFGGKGNRMGVSESGKDVPQNNRNQQEGNRSAWGTDNGTGQNGTWSNGINGDKGTLAGNTDSNGQVVYTFSTAGQYGIAAYENGYRPGLAKITINQ